jgi:hypothetical protein
MTYDVLHVKLRVRVSDAITYAMSGYHHKVVSSNPVDGEVYLIQHYVIKCVSDLRQVGGFLQILKSNFVMIATHCIGSCKYSYHMITTTTAPKQD